ncbi:MAG: WYL domain-containing protein [Butyrivibrio sp.]|nr:WYL domain-containing protein [Butyrivibrio sp.]
MPKGANQKLKLFYLYKILMEETDDGHGITMPQIQEFLAEKGVTADRKSIYDDLEALRFLGYDVILEKEGRNSLYHMGEKEFEIAELKLLVDAIQSSKFITEKKSNTLIKKLTGFASRYEATQLKRQVFVQGRIKTMNESIYYIVDEIHNAIMSNRQITFEYMNWNTKKEMVPRKEGLYKVSPWALTWDDENYYLIGFEGESGLIKHYRVDKMRKIDITEKKREGREHFDAFDMAKYAKMNFGMFGGKEETVKMAFKESFVGVIIDRFGKDITIRPSKEEGWFETNVEVAVSDQFFGWIFALGRNVKILGPDHVVKQLKAEIGGLSEMYN